MTPIELERLVKEQDAERLVQAMSSLSDSERKPLAKTAARLFRARDRLLISPDNTCEALAVLGLCSWSQAKRTEVFAWGRARELPYRVLKARRPEWLDQWIEKELADGSIHWHLIWRLVRAGICQKPKTDNYITRMLRASAGLEHFDSSLADHLRKNGEILVDLWRIFEIDFGREGVLYGDADGHPHSWQSALISLTNSGELNRGRMLTASLTARQSRGDNASFFCKLHEALNPALDERVERQAFYRALLCSPHPHVVGFALGAFKAIAETGRLEIESFLGAVGLALELRQKGHATAAAQVLELAARQSPGQLGAIAAVAARGLGHASPDVQKRCVKLVESAAAGAPNAVLAAEIDARIGLVTPSVKARVDRALAQVRVGSPVLDGEPPLGGPEISQVEIESIDPHWRQLAGIDDCLRALRENDNVPPLGFDPMSVPRLDPDAALTPIATFDDLVDRASTAVEELADADEFELLLDALSRHCGILRLDFAARTAPLRNRIEKLIEGLISANNRWALHSLDPATRFRFLLRSWFSGQPVEISRWLDGSAGHEAFISLRIVALSRRLPRHIAGPLLACPTHRGGWIDPRELVKRLRFWQQQDSYDGRIIGPEHEFSIPDRFDFIQALLRLAPDHRPEALDASQDLTEETGKVVRFALGGEEPGGCSPGLWIAAARAREPRGAFPAITRVHGDLGPDAGLPSTYEWELHDPDPHRTVWPGPRLELRVQPTVQPIHLKFDRPLAYINNLNGNFAMDSILNLRCRAAVWPANLDASFAAGAIAIVSRLNSLPSTLSPTAQNLDPLFDPDTPFTEMARLILAVALLSKDAGTRGLGIDALIALIEDGRCIGDELEPIYGKLASTKELLRLNRLVESLAQVARISALHEWTIVRILQGTLGALPSPLPSDLHHLLSAMYEGLLKIGQPLAPQCGLRLESITTSGKTGSLAKSILRMRLPPGPNPMRVAALKLALTGRVARAKRWASRGGVGGA